MLLGVSAVFEAVTALALVLSPYARLGSGLSSLGLWPAVLAHAALGGWCAVRLRASRPAAERAIVNPLG